MRPSRSWTRTASTRVGRLSRRALVFGPTLDCIEREDIVDLALGEYTREEGVLERAAIIRRKQEEHWRSLPAFMAGTKDEDVDFRKLEAARYALQERPQAGCSRRNGFCSAGTDPQG